MAQTRARHLLVKGWGFFDVMHQDRRVARIYENGIATIYYKSFMPYNLYLENGDDTDICINNLTNFYHWCASRILTLDRKYAKEILNSIGAIQAYTDRDRAAIAISYRALSLMDVYWVRAKGDTKSYAEISLYNHSLSKAFVDVSLKGKNLTAANAELITWQDEAGDVGTPGVAPKAWIREDDVFYLLKDGDQRDVGAELLASKIVDCFDVEHVSYCETYFGDVRVSKCRIITSEQVSLVSSEFIEIYCMNHDKDKMAFVLKKDAYSYYMMNIIDYLIGNTDRHWGNWGFMVDNATNKIIKIHPLMDFNKAFLSYETVDGALCQTTETQMSQRQAAIEAVRKIGLNQIGEIDLSWFDDRTRADMFFERLNILKQVAAETQTR